MIFMRKGVCSVCGCTVTVACHDSLARILKRIDAFATHGCPQCGSALAWKNAPEVWRRTKRTKDDDRLA